MIDLLLLWVLCASFGIGLYVLMGLYLFEGWRYYRLMRKRMLAQVPTRRAA